MKHISIFMAFFAGVVSFISPCVLPLIPAYINVLTKQDKRKDIVLIRSILFVCGFTFVFIIMGASATALGKLFQNNINLFRIISGIIIILFGIYTLEIIKVGSLYKEKRLFNKLNDLGPFIMGIAFSAGWTPCVGPILGSIIVYTSINANLNGIFMLGFYSLGLGVPFILCALLIDKFIFVRKYIYKYMSLIKKITGILMIIIGILMITNKLVVFIGILS